MYDHKAKVASWKTARVVLQLVILPGLLGLFWVANHLSDRAEFVDVPATVTEVREICRAVKKQPGKRSADRLEHGAIALDCIRFRALVAKGIREDEYQLIKTREVSFRYRSPADNQMHVGEGKLEMQDVFVGDKILIKASRSDFRKTVLNPHGS